MYYNTTNATGSQLALFQHKALRQDVAIYNHLKEISPHGKTRDEIHEVLFQNAPASSIGRALTNLMNDGKVYKLDIMRPGRYGRPQHVYALNPNYPWTQNNEQ